MEVFSESLNFLITLRYALLYMPIMDLIMAGVILDRHLPLSILGKTAVRTPIQKILNSGQVLAKIKLKVIATNKIIL
ncbi:hypothetical protein D9M68_562160 [compost metagenome]